jgi:hypothetical protein
MTGASAEQKEYRLEKRQVNGNRFPPGHDNDKTLRLFG